MTQGYIVAGHVRQQESIVDRGYNYKEIIRANVGTGKYNRDVIRHIILRRRGAPQNTTNVPARNDLAKSTPGKKQIKRYGTRLTCCARAGLSTPSGKSKSRPAVITQRSWWSREDVPKLCVNTLYLINAKQLQRLTCTTVNSSKVGWAFAIIVIEHRAELARHPYHAAGRDTHADQAQCSRVRDTKYRAGQSGWRPTAPTAGFREASESTNLLFDGSSSINEWIRPQIYTILNILDSARLSEKHDYNYNYTLNRAEKCVLLFRRMLTRQCLLIFTDNREW